MDNRTKQCKRLSILFGILHFLCLFGPFFYFIPYAFIVGKVINKLTLSVTLIISLMLAAYSLFTDAKHRGGLSKTIMWILVIGISACLAQIEVFIYIMATISIIDELFIIRMLAKYKDAYAANREIDRRNKV